VVKTRARSLASARSKSSMNYDALPHVTCSIGRMSRVGVVKGLNDEAELRWKI
jgi:hypothetical protein